MDIEQIHATARNLAQIGVSIVLLIGGEPFIRKDLAAIIRAFTDNGIHVRMQTNGYASEKRLEECIAAGGHDISISLDSLSSDTQDYINGIPNSWQRTLKTVATVNSVFPENGKGFFGTVIMHNNLKHIAPVIEFATRIGWWVSLVPCHATSPDNPLGFRTLDNHQDCTIPKEQLPDLYQVIEELKELRNIGAHLYDCDEYLDDIPRFLAGEKTHWRKRNGGVCDSPNLYFAIEPNGNFQPCCDHKLSTSFAVYDKNFPELYENGTIARHTSRYTQDCQGCMYGSYPEITLSARFIKPLLHRTKLFLKSSVKHRKLNYQELLEIAQDVTLSHSVKQQG